MARPTGTALDYVGQIEPNRKFPGRWLNPPRGHRLVVIRERFKTYLYQTKRSTRLSSIEEFTDLAFPNGCAVQLLNTPRNH